jgi:hypothetical protein
MISKAFLVDVQGADDGDHALLSFRNQQCVSDAEFKHVRSMGMDGAATRGHEDCAALAGLLLRMSRTQRRRVETLCRGGAWA